MEKIYVCCEFSKFYANDKANYDKKWLNNIHEKPFQNLHSERVLYLDTEPSLVCYLFILKAFTPGK